ncbi:hypothetical protein GCWU000342_01842 [Shuttleworthella satelles DSM 14600]|uniref:Uncharacterized protein n=1 Tax=Shuttleworthella satelles DSM 14600 TaxID=626523 RepID=C4GCZ8_9FIRM|nr:hypothetical protein GCWU000342_01842 [Shuttleworthia satelles DSM 14600]
MTMDSPQRAHSIAHERGFRQANIPSLMAMKCRKSVSSVA